jgi:hypothetical protein
MQSENDFSMDDDGDHGGGHDHHNVDLVMAIAISLE